MTAHAFGYALVLVAFALAFATVREALRGGLWPKN